MLPNDDISFQLFSARNFPPLAAQLETLKGLGFTDVQPYFSQGNQHTPPLDASSTREALDRLGLTARTGHFDVALFEDDFDEVLRIAHILGMELVIAPWLERDERPTDRAAWEAFGLRLAAVSRRVADAGLRFAWHNHDFEFVPLPDGSYPIEHALGDNVLWEPDLAWLTIGGQDPAHWLQHYAGRVTALHVKDVAPPGLNEEEDGFADLGTGIMPWAELLPLATRSGAELFVLEHDNPSDYRRFASNSIAALRRLAA